MSRVRMAISSLTGGCAWVAPTRDLQDWAVLSSPAARAASAAHSPWRYNPAPTGAKGCGKGEAMERLKTGDKIYSSQFGRGEVLEVEGMGPGETVRVLFEGGEVRTLRPEQHRLELL